MILSAAEIGIELSSFVRYGISSDEEQAQVRVYVGLLFATPGLTSVDALAFVALAESLMRQASAAIEAENVETGGYLLDVAAALSRRALEALELEAGLPREVFSDAPRNLH